jgi:hypothetical protein
MLTVARSAGLLLLRQRGQDLLDLLLAVAHFDQEALAVPVPERTSWRRSVMCAPAAARRPGSYPAAVMASTKVFDNRPSCAIYQRFKG